jgi:hypothetical protein
MNKDNIEGYMPLIEAMLQGRDIYEKGTYGEWVLMREVAFTRPAECYKAGELQLWQPPPGETLHNPDGLSAYEVGRMRRLLTVNEVKHAPHFRHEMLASKLPGCDVVWFDYGDGNQVLRHSRPENMTYGVPVATPVWTLPSPKMVPLSAEDIPTGSIFQRIGETDPFAGCAIMQMRSGGLTFYGPWGPWSATWLELQARWLIKRPSDAVWRACEKEAPV